MEQQWEEDDLKAMLDKYDAVTLPVNIAIEGNQQVLNMEQVKNILSKASLISVRDCYCRETLKNCDKPLRVCLSMDTEATRGIEEGEAEEITFLEAVEILEQSYRAGLVHLAYNIKGAECDIICSCCSCCCHHMNALTRFGYHEAVIKSAFVSQWDRSLCTDCGICVERCQFGAWDHDDNRVIFIQENCYGCGLCISTCPTQAISFIKR
jgi:NAD-dependent dihydropyrimidine dehydrogenase PreA subunit